MHRGLSFMARQGHVGGGVRNAWLFVGVLWLAGCGTEAPLQTLGLSVVVPEDWESVNRMTWPVPGKAIAAWRGPRSSLVIYTSLPIPKPDVKALQIELANRLTNLTDLDVGPTSTLTIDGNLATRIEAVGPGTGEAFASSSAGVAHVPDGMRLQPTHLVWIIIPRPDSTINLVWYAPELDKATLDVAIASTLTSLKVEHRSAYQSDTY